MRISAGVDQRLGVYKGLGFGDLVKESPTQATEAAEAAAPLRFRPVRHAEARRGSDEKCKENFPSTSFRCHDRFPGWSYVKVQTNMTVGVSGFHRRLLLSFYTRWVEKQCASSKSVDRAWPEPIRSRTRAAWSRAETATAG